VNNHLVTDLAGRDAIADLPRGTFEPEARMKNSLAVVVTIAFSVVGVLGDYLLKLASSRQRPLESRWFYLGFAVYASTAFGWVFVMRHLKLATIGVVYSISMILLLTGIGVVSFREPLNAFEFAGLAMAIGALILLVRFA
jgi:small multidrug resistance pump